MIIKCQEHYEKTVKYAESIGDETLNKCIERLKQWETNSNGKYEIEFMLRFFAIFIQLCGGGERWEKGDCRRTALSWQPGPITCRNDWRAVPWLEHTYLN